MAQRRIEDASETEHELHAPPHKRRKLSSDSTVPPYTETSYENTHTHGNARAHYGHVFNLIAPAQASTIPHVSSPLSQDVQSGAPDTARWIKAIRFDGMGLRLATIRSAHSGTCEWLFARQEYKTWRDSSQADLHHGFLWIKGKPGAGKSTLMKSAYTCGQQAPGEDVILSHFFSARASQLHYSAEGMYRSLLCQLLDKFPSLSSSLKSLGLSLDLESSVFYKEQLEALLREAILRQPSKHVTCYIDAIDECEYLDAQDVVDSLQDLHQIAQRSGLNLRVLISSRHYRQLTSDCRLQITLDHIVEHEEDISTYIRSRLRVGGSCKAREIRRTIQQKSSGVFLWVVLIIQILNKDKACGKVHLLMDRLAALPEDLHRLFENILQCGTGEHTTLTLTFQLLLFAHRTFYLNELYCALVSSETKGAIQALDPEHVSVKDMENYVLDSSKGLVEVIADEERTVQFIHETVRDYLLETWLPALYGRSGRTMVALCHDRLKHCCLRYVLRSSPVVHNGPSKSSEWRIRDGVGWTHPFLYYALHGLLKHANKSQSLGCEQRDFIRGFDPKSWVRSYNALYDLEEDRTEETVCRDYVFVLTNALNLVEVSLRQTASLLDVCCEAPEEKHGALLGVAVLRGYEAMAKLLLEEGADPNSVATGNFSCLDVATAQVNVEMTSILLQHGATVPRSTVVLPGTQFYSPHVTTGSECVEVVSIILLCVDPTRSGLSTFHWQPAVGSIMEATKCRGSTWWLLYSQTKSKFLRSNEAKSGMLATRLGDVNCDGDDDTGTLHSFNITFGGSPYCTICINVTTPRNALAPTKRQFLVAANTVAQGLLRRHLSILERPRSTHSASLIVENTVAGFRQHIEVSPFADDWDCLLRSIWHAFSSHSGFDPATSPHSYNFANADFYDVSQPHPVCLRNGTLPVFASMFAPQSHNKFSVCFDLSGSHDSTKDVHHLDITIVSKDGQTLRYLVTVGSLLPKGPSWWHYSAFHGEEWVVL